MIVAAITAVAAVLTSVPVIAVVLVSVASRREDREWTLAGPPPGPGSVIARRIVGFHSRGIEGLLQIGRSRDDHDLAGTTRPGSRKDRSLSLYPSFHQNT
jgi:hypothetical protein